MEYRPTVLMNSRTYRALLCAATELEDPKTGTRPISFKRLISGMATSWISYNLPEYKDTEED